MMHSYMLEGKPKNKVRVLNLNHFQIEVFYDMIDKQLYELKKLGSLSNRNSYFYLNLNKELFIDFGTLKNHGWA